MSLASCYHPAYTHSSGPPTRDLPVLTPTLVLSLRVPLCRRRQARWLLRLSKAIFNNDAVQGETFLPRQIIVFGGFALRANSLGRLEQIESYAPGRQVRFGSLNYTADIRGDLILDGFEPLPMQRETAQVIWRRRSCRHVRGSQKYMAYTPVKMAWQTLKLM